MPERGVAPGTCPFWRQSQQDGFHVQICYNDQRHSGANIGAAANEATRIEHHVRQPLHQGSINDLRRFGIWNYRECLRLWSAHVFPEFVASPSKRRAKRQYRYWPEGGPEERFGRGEMALQRALPARDE